MWRSAGHTVGSAATLKRKSSFAPATRRFALHAAYVISGLGAVGLFRRLAKPIG